MKPAAFGYHRVTSIAEAVEVLSTYEGTSRILAGGQSLVPMLNMRLIQPEALVDVNEVAELSHIEERDGRIVVGAMVRYCELEASSVVAERLPLVASVLRHIGDRQVRNRGTIGGSLAQGDPTGEIPLACLVLGASVRVVGPGGSRRIPVSDLYVDSYATSLDALEVLTEVDIPVGDTHVAFLERCRRHNDFAVISVACTGRREMDGRWSDVRVGLGGVAATPVVATGVGEALEGSILDDREIYEVSALVSSSIDPPSDIRASAEYRRHLAPVYVQRALKLLCAGAVA